MALVKKSNYFICGHFCCQWAWSVTIYFCWTVHMGPDLYSLLLSSPSPPPRQCLVRVLLPSHLAKYLDITSNFFQPATATSKGWPHFLPRSPACRLIMLSMKYGYGTPGSDKALTSLGGCQLCNVMARNMTIHEHNILQTIGWLGTEIRQKGALML